MSGTISVFGIGYVGAVSAGCFAQTGRKVIAVDPIPEKVNAITLGQAPIYEPGLGGLIETAAREGVLTATSSAFDAIQQSDVSLVCVGTPSRADGSLDTRFAEMVSEEIGVALKAKSEAGGAFHSVVFRSTLLPGTMRDIVIPILERASGLSAGEDFGVGYFPEFLREGTAIADFHKPGAIVFGAIDATTAERLSELNAGLGVEPQVLDITAAESVKYANNAWHAVKICFANEIGNFCAAHGVDSHKVMDVVCSDTRLNVSRAYMKPGFAFGGSCLPKDLRAFRSRAVERGVPTPIMDAALEANRLQVERAYKMVSGFEGKRVGLVGLSFKPDTDDLRESPLVDLAERLCGEGYDVKILDSNVQKSRHGGAAGHPIDANMPHLSALLTDGVNEFLSDVDTLVIGVNGDDKHEVLSAMGEKELNVVDLVRIENDIRSADRYQGICW